VLVHFVDDDYAGQPELACLGEDAARVDLNPRVGVDNDHRRLHGRQRANGLAEEVGVAGRVNGIEPFAGVREVNDARLDRMLVRLFLGVEVADAGAVGDAVVAADRAGLDEELVNEVRLATPPCPQKAMLRTS
jgi:hypothetical protein